MIGEVGDEAEVGVGEEVVDAESNDHVPFSPKDVVATVNNATFPIALLHNNIGSLHLHLTRHTSITSNDTGSNKYNI